MTTEQNTPGPGYSIAEFQARVGKSRSTINLWMAKGYTPRTIRLPNGQLRIPTADWDAWFAQRDKDRVRIGRPGLARPLYGFEEAVQVALDHKLDAQLEEVALGIFRSAKKAGVALSDEALGNVIAGAVSRAREQNRAEVAT